MKKLTLKIKEDYINSNGTVCPFCGSFELYGGDRDTNSGIHTQNVKCLSCHKEWTDIYKLVSIE